MAQIDRIWLHDADKYRGEATAYISLKPAGEVALKFKIPDQFMDCILTMAQAVADKHEQEMRAQILADNYKEQP